jgi:putative inorganic carbon (hco3(-)) transporter
VRLRLSDDHARSLAAVGLLGLVLAVTAYGMPKVVGSVSVDTVVLGVPVAILLCLPYVRRRGLESVPTYLMGPAALLFLVWGLLSVVADGGQFSSLLTIARYASYFLLAIVVSVVTQDAGIRRMLLWAIALTAGATAVLAFAQYFNPQLTPGMNGISPEISTRVVGTFYNSNFYAEYLLLATGVAGALFFTEKGFARVVSAVLGVLVVVAMLLTYTRGSWIGLAIAVIVFVTVVDVRYLAAVAAVGMAGVLLVPGVAVRLTQSTANSSSADFRLGIWKIAGEAMRTKPLFGYGAGDFLVAYRAVVIAHPEFYQGYLGFGAHNAYFELAAEIGVLGGLLFLFITAVYATRGLFIATRRDVDQGVKYTALALSSVLIGFVANTFTSNTFQHPQSGLFFWILAGMVAGLGVGAWDSEARPLDCELRADEGVVGGSLANRMVSAMRRFFGDMWRASTCFYWTGARGTAGSASGWFASSAVMRWVFGPGAGEGSKRD